MKKTLTLLPLLALITLLVVAASMPKYVGKFYGDGVGLTNITGYVTTAQLAGSTNISTLKISGSNIVDAISVTELNAGTLTLTNKIDGTNIIGGTVLSTNQGSTVLNFPTVGTKWYMFSTNNNWAFSLGNLDPYLTNVQTICCIWTNTAGSTKTVKFPDGTIIKDGLTQYGTNQSVFTVTHYPGGGTNAAFYCNQ